MGVYSLTVVVGGAGVGGLFRFFFGKALNAHSSKLTADLEKLRTQLAGGVKDHEAALAKNLENLKASLTTGVKDHEATLTKELEHVRTDLRAVQHRNELLNEKRAEVIAKMYELLVEAEYSSRALTSPFQRDSSDDSEREKQQLDRQKRAAKDGRAFEEFLRKNLIYVDKRTGDLLEGVRVKFRDAFIDHSMSSDDPKLWIEAWKTIKTQVPPLRESLEREFRILLGVEVASDSGEAEKS